MQQNNHNKPNILIPNPRTTKKTSNNHKPNSPTYSFIIFYIIVFSFKFTFL